MSEADRIVAEARALQAEDLERARSALQSANACGNFDGVAWRIARVELDAEPPLPMVVDVKASDLPGPRLPREPERPDVVYVPPEERGASPRVGVAREVLPGGGVVIELGARRYEEIDGHRFAEGDVFCADCGQHISKATKHPCG